MTRHRYLLQVSCALWIGAATSIGQCSDVLDRLPNDALGFVVVRDLAQVDAKTESWRKAFNSPFPGPLDFLKLAAGVSEGLNVHGEFMVAMLPGDRPELCVWLPVEDYGKMIGSLHGTTQERIAAVTIAGEDVLMAKHGDWTLVMDPEQRAEMEAMLDAQPTPLLRIAAWRSWIHTNDVTAVLLPTGIRAAWNWTMKSAEGRPPDEPSPEIAVENPFGDVNNENAVAETGSASGVWPAARNAARDFLGDAPALASAITETEAIALGVRCDEQGNAIGSVRLAAHDGWTLAAVEEAAPADRSLPPCLFQAGEFIVSGAGCLPTSLAKAAAGIYTRLLISGLRTDFHMEFDDEAAARMQGAVDRTVADVQSWEVLRRPGENQEGVYTNSFFAVRVSSAGDFLAHAADVMRFWNEMNRDAPGEARLVFETEQLRIGDRDAVQYWIDMATAIGSAGLPNERKALEQLFGPGGKLRAYLVAVDDHTVLIATATEAQTAAAVQAMSLGQVARWDREPLQHANQILPDEADWRVFFSPHGYTLWLKRQMDAVLGPVIGGPIVREFPQSPPVGIAGGFGKQELWFDAAIPSQTIQQAAAYLQQR